VAITQFSPPSPRANYIRAYGGDRGRAGVQIFEVFVFPRLQNQLMPPRGSVKGLLDFGVCVNCEEIMRIGEEKTVAGEMGLGGFWGCWSTACQCCRDWFILLAV